MKPRLLPAARLSYPLTTAIAALLALQSASATDFWWDGGTANWSTASAWSTVAGAATPDPGNFPSSATTSDLFFNRTNNNSVSNIISMAGGDRAANSLTFTNSGTTNFRAGGASTATSILTIGAGGITLASTSGAVLFGDTPGSYGTLSITLSASQIWTNNSGSTLTVAGAVGGGAVQLTKSGTGQIRLNGANTYSGATVVNGGDLTIGNYSGLSNTSGITVSGGTAGLNLAQVGTGTTSNTINKTLSLHGFLRTIGGSSTNRLNQSWDGNITLAGASTITNNGNSQFDINGQVDLGAHTLTFQTDGTSSRIDGNIVGVGGSLIKTSAQDLTLTGTNTYSGTTQISGGTVILGNVNALQNTTGISMAAGTVLRSNIDAATVTAPITLSGAGNVTFAVGTAAALQYNLNSGIGGNTGTLILTTHNVDFNNVASTISLGATSNYSGNTTITTGNTNNRLTVVANATNSLSPTTVLTLDGGMGVVAGGYCSMIWLDMARRSPV